MRFPVRVRIVLASVTVAAISILSMAASVIADSGPVPFPR